MSSSSKTVAHDDYDETREDCSGDGDDDYVVSVGDSVGFSSACWLVVFTFANPVRDIIATIL